MTTVSDLAGKQVGVGDRVAAAFRDSTTAYLRLGTVQSFGTRAGSEWKPVKQTMRVAWDTESGPRGASPVAVVGSIEVGLARFVKLEA
jgi:hypothetical protein